ncbi:MAG TPA: hypothetical protein VEV85_12090 [Bryobacteraceae bacterium]|nr:hypothetical protein [Bryobacteraceae bacterium]
MSTERQRESARINGARFRGPVTAEGKQISSRNSTRHGMLAQTVVLEGESKDRFQELLDGLIAEFQPGSTTETALVETMAIARWRYLRILSLQKSRCDLEIASEASSSPKPVRAALAFRKLSDNSRRLDLLLRYETAFDRQFSRALSTLLKLRAQSPAASRGTTRITKRTQPSGRRRCSRSPLAGFSKRTGFHAPSRTDLHGGAGFSLAGL